MKNLLILMLGISILSPAWAHRLNVFAWPEDGMLKVQATFAGGAKARAAKVVVTSDSGQVLATGQTNNLGKAEIALPNNFQPQDLKVTVNAGEGHQKTWSIAASELGGSSAVLPKAKDQEPKEYTRAQLQAALLAQKQEIERQELAPLRARLLELTNKDPGLVEIVGGAGWLIGLAGLAAWFRRRPNKS